MAKLQVFDVPNDAYGRKFIRELKKYLNRATYKVRVRGRHPNRKKLFGKDWRQGRNTDVKLKDAETFGVYLDFKDESGYRLVDADMENAYERARTNANISEAELNQLRVQKESLQKELLNYKAKAKSYEGTGVSKGRQNTSSRKIRLKSEEENDNQD